MPRSSGHNDGSGHRNSNEGVNRTDSASEIRSDDKNAGEKERWERLFGNIKELQASRERDQPPTPEEQMQQLQLQQRLLQQFYQASEKAGIHFWKPADNTTPWEKPKHKIHWKRVDDTLKRVSKELAKPEE